MRRRSLTALGGALLLPGTRAQDLPVMRWQVRDMPPHFNYRDGKPPERLEELGHGSVDGFMRLLLRQLPQYRHEFIEATAARAQAMTREGKTLCSMIHIYTPERLAERYFTPAYPVLGQLQAQVVVHRSQLARFKAMGQPLSLATLMQRRDVSGMMSAERSFGAGVDRVVRAQGEVSNLKPVVVMRHSSVLTMLRARRMDYALDFPAGVEEYLRSVGAPGELVCLPMAEAPLIALSYASCTRNEEGRRQIEAIDQAVRRMAQPAGREAWLQIWRDKPFEAADLARLKRFYDERARTGPQIE
jgi:uncharacterized protein (TIGR02285 family)